MIIDRCIGEVLKEFDRDRNGVLNRRETLHFIKKTLAELHEDEKFTSESFTALFDSFDTNKSGNLSKKELRELIKMMISVLN